MCRSLLVATNCGRLSYWGDVHLVDVSNIESNCCEKYTKSNHYTRRFTVINATVLTLNDDLKHIKSWNANICYSYCVCACVCVCVMMVVSDVLCLSKQTHSLTCARFVKYKRNVSRFEFMLVIVFTQSMSLHHWFSRFVPCLSTQTMLLQAF